MLLGIIFITEAIAILWILMKALIVLPLSRGKTMLLTLRY